MKHRADYKNLWGYLVLAILLLVLVWLLLESRQRSEQIEDMLKQTTNSK